MRKANKFFIALFCALTIMPSFAATSKAGAKKTKPVVAISPLTRTESDGVTCQQLVGTNKYPDATKLTGTPPDCVITECDKKKGLEPSKDGKSCQKNQARKACENKEKGTWVETGGICTCPKQSEGYFWDTATMKCVQEDVDNQEILSAKQQKIANGKKRIQDSINAGVSVGITLNMKGLYDPELDSELNKWTKACKNSAKPDNASKLDTTYVAIGTKDEIKCIVDSCKNGYKPSSDKTKCEEDTDSKRSLCNQKQGRWDGVTCWCGAKVQKLDASATVCQQKNKKPEETQTTPEHSEIQKLNPETTSLTVATGATPAVDSNRIRETLPKEVKKYTGTIVDDNNEPLIGANIVNKEKSDVGCITDIDGNFSCDLISPNVVISYTGYKTIEMSFDKQNGIKVTLQEEHQEIETVETTSFAASFKKDVKTLSDAFDAVKDKLCKPQTNGKRS